MTQYMIGMDCGGTKSRGVLADGDLNVLARATGGPGNPLSSGMAVVRRSYRDVIRRLLSGAGLRPRAVVAVGIGAAGAGRESERRRIAGWIRRLLPSAAIAADTDAMIALLGATSGRPGIIVISGTGSIVLGFDRKGRTIRGGGWGALLGDEGSGAAIGREAIRSVLRAEDGRCRRTGLREEILSFFRVRSPGELVTRIYRKPPMPREYARLWPSVRALAESGDIAARTILRNGGAELAEIVEAVAGRLDLGKDPVPLILSGGVLAQESLLRRTLLRRIRKTVPHARLAEPQAAPEIGALWLARRAIKAGSKTRRG